MDFIQLEKNILIRNCITKQDIEEEIRNLYDASNFDSYDQFETNIDIKVQDEIEKYRKLKIRFSNQVFQINYKDEFSIEIASTFKAREEYKLCLYSSSGDNTQKVTELFEYITGEAIKSYLGENSEYRLVDINNDVDIEAICKEQLKEECQPNCQEIFKNSESPLRTDILAWKKIDNNKGKIICLAQCKSGKNWRGGNPVNIDGWKRIIIFIAEPIKFFAISDLLDETDFLDRGTEKGIILDRGRIISLLANVENQEIKAIREKIKEAIE